MISIQLPDGSRREFPGPVTVEEVAASIGPGLAKAALGGRIGAGKASRVVDTSFRIDHDEQLAIVTDKDADGLELIRHSTAHLLAYAVKELFPDAQVTIGPVIENGFYYDFAYKRPFTPEDLAAIEAKMTELAKKDEPVTRRVLPRDEAVAHFNAMGEAYKAEIIARIPAGEDVSLYREGAFEDLCRGPHVPRTGKLQALQADEGRRRLLARRLEQRDAAAHLRHGLGDQGRAAAVPAHARGGREARPPQARPRARPVPHRRGRARASSSGTRRAGRSGRRSSATCARSTATPATRRSRARSSSTRACGRRPATGRTTARTCSRRSRRSTSTRSSR